MLLSSIYSISWKKNSTLQGVRQAPPITLRPAHFHSGRKNSQASHRRNTSNLRILFERKWKNCSGFKIFIDLTKISFYFRKKNGAVFDW